MGLDQHLAIPLWTIRKAHHEIQTERVPPNQRGMYGAPFPFFQRFHAWCWTPPLVESRRWRKRLTIRRGEF